MIDITGSKSKIINQPLPVDDPMQRCPDIAKARTLLAGSRRCRCGDGLKRTIDYFDRLLSASTAKATV